MQRERARTGRTVAIVTGIVFIVVLASVAVFWQDIRVAWIVRGLQRDPSQLVDVLEASRGSEASRRSVERFVRSEDGAHAILGLYADTLLNGLNDHFSSPGMSRHRSRHRIDQNEVGTTLFWYRYDRVRYEQYDSDRGSVGAGGWALNNEDRRRTLDAIAAYLSVLDGRSCERQGQLIRIADVRGVPEFADDVQVLQPQVAAYALILDRSGQDSDAGQSE